MFVFVLCFAQGTGRDHLAFWYSDLLAWYCGGPNIIIWLTEFRVALLVSMRRGGTDTVEKESQPPGLVSVRVPFGHCCATE